jgi:hypothetical protein
MIPILVVLAACSGRPAQQAASAPKPKSDSTSAESDTSRESRNRGVPFGYLGRTEDPQDRLDDVTYHIRGNRWAITTGPAHIMYSLRDTMSGEFIVASTFDQKELDHSASFGLFVGGTDLDQPGRRYTYFSVRANGEYSVQVREGDAIREIIPWTTQKPVGSSTSERRVRHRLAVRVHSDSIRFLYNGTPIAAVQAGSVPTDGIAGLRLDRNIRVTVDRLRASS